MKAILLDTCAAIWLAGGERLSPEALDAITGAAVGRGVYVSPASAWEIGLLARAADGPAFRPDPTTWFARLMAAPGVKEAALTTEIAIAASRLPGAPRGDPIDHLLIATARHLSLPIVTRDWRILAYAEADHVDAIEC